VLLLDEPAAGLDPQARRDLSHLLLALRDGGMTLVVSSHILAELEDYSDRMVILDNGRIAGGESISLKSAGRLRLKLAAAKDGLEDFLKARGIAVLEAGADHAVITLTGEGEERAALLARLIAAGYPVCEFREDSQALEEVYFARIGKQR